MKKTRDDFKSNAVKCISNFDNLHSKNLNSIKFLKMGPSFVNKMYENIKHWKKLFARYKTLELNQFFIIMFPEFLKTIKKSNFKFKSQPKIVQKSAG
jgi:hypothetical protein